MRIHSCKRPPEKASGTLRLLLFYGHPGSDQRSDVSWFMSPRSDIPWFMSIGPSLMHTELCPQIYYRLIRHCLFPDFCGFLGESSQIIVNQELKLWEEVLFKKRSYFLQRDLRFYVGSRVFQTSLFLRLKYLY